MKICSKCQTECDDQMKFCLNCGTPFETDEAVPEEEPELTLALPEEEEEPEVQLEIPPAVPAAAPAATVPAALQEDEYDEEEDEPAGKVKRTMSVLAVLSVIFGFVGVFAGGYACLLSFLNILVALIFYLPSVLGIVFGLLALRNAGRGRKHKGRILAFLGIILGVLSLVLWLIGTFYLRGMVAAQYGTMDLMSVVRVISTKL